MCFKSQIYVVLLLLCCSCAVKRQMTEVLTGELKAEIAVSSMEASIVSSIDNSDDTLLTMSAVMNAQKDSITGEMVATDVLRASRVVARFRHSAERGGLVRIEFDLCVPADMIVSKWKLGFYPRLTMGNDSCALEPVFVTGEEYRGRQLRGYQRYQKFLDGIITDSDAFIRKESLEIFIRRHFPQIYKMKSDSSFVAEYQDESLFGVTVKDAVEHYKKHFLIKRNNRKINDSTKVFKSFVKDPIQRENVRLDTVMSSFEGDLIYRYQQVLDYRPMLKKIILDTDVRLYENGDVLAYLESPQSLTYYISSLSSLVDKRLKYCFCDGELVVDTLYMRGVELMEKADYKKSLKILRPYNDYNTALALLLSGYDESALSCLLALVDKSSIVSSTDATTVPSCEGTVIGTPIRELAGNVFYLMAVSYSRLGEDANAIKAYKRSIDIDSSLVHRANLDPEVYELLNRTSFFNK